MGRIFEKRKYKMFARWAKMAKAFTKIGKEIAISVKLGGANPEGNPRLRMAIQTARTLNMPKDRVEAAIQRATSKDASQLAEVTYEGFGPHGVAIFVEAATDNPTRTVGNVRSIFNAHGGSLGTSGSLSYLFHHKGMFTIVPPAGVNSDDLQLELIDAGVEEFVENEEGLLLITGFAEYGGVQKALEAKKIEIKHAGLHRIPANHVEVSPPQEAELTALIDALEEDDDVQHVFHNMTTKE